MHESEANWVVGSTEEIPAELQACFLEARAGVSARSLIVWGEHCSECVWPSCYSTCDLFVPRPDGRCRRFTEGMVRIPLPGAVNSCILKITFKRWAKLWATARIHVVPMAEADKHEKRDLRIAAWLHRVPVKRPQIALIRKRYSWKKRTALRRGENLETPNCLLIECYNPGAQPVDMTLSARVKGAPLAFQSRLTMQPGFNRHRIGVEQIGRLLDLSLPLELDLAPNGVDDTCTLYFGAMDFVRDKQYALAQPPESENKKKPRICKCVVWDLDNTLWNGTLVEDGVQRLTLKADIAEIIRALDERGILISAASKNDHEEAMEALRRFGLAEYFLFPQINWMPKSEGIRTIASELNVGMGSLLFVDDSQFEREQVLSECPEVAIMDALAYKQILRRPDTQAPVTEESRKRRLFYREQQVRDGARKSYAGEYLEFLRNCALRLTLHRLTNRNMERVHELTQRTNQMNFSGNLYSREQLEKITTDMTLDTYVMDCQDRFGDYGTVGFAIVNSAENRLTDLMFSCRVQGKRVEHAFLNYLLRRHLCGECRSFSADYRKTTRNSTSGKVFEDLGFIADREDSGVRRLVYPADRQPSEERIVEIVEAAEALREKALA